MSALEVHRFEPPVTATSAPFWNATRVGVLQFQWCRNCEQSFFFPRAVCPRCLGIEWEWRPSTGRGTIYALTVEHHAQNPLMADRVPYVVALIDMDEGVRLMSNVVGSDSDQAQIGDGVIVAWEPLSDGRQLPVFTRRAP